jgi:hypothetical protein
VIVLEVATDVNGNAIKPKKNPDDYKPSDLLTYKEADQRKPDKVPYIATQFSAKEFEKYRIFKVGDGKNYSVGARKRRDISGQYYNGPLEPETYYSMFQRASVSKVGQIQPGLIKCSFKLSKIIAQHLSTLTLCWTM